MLASLVLSVVSVVIAADLPKVEDPAVMAALRSAKTFWYDDQIIPPAYQDAVPPITGLRSTHDSVYTHNDQTAGLFAGGRFVFPFGKTAGTDRASVHTWKFLSLPESKGKRWPVVVWRNGLEYRWAFPRGSLVGEVLFQSGPEGWVAFEVRTRERKSKRWETDVFRPCPTAKHFAAAIPAEEKALIAWANDSKSIKPYRLQGAFFASDGALDYVPPMKAELVEKILNRPFKSCNGEPWKVDGQTICHAPIAARGQFSFVPSDYLGGCVPSDVESCTRCHQSTGRPIAHFRDIAVLYGTVWGSDQVFSFHPLNPAATESDSDYSSPANDLRQDFFRSGMVEFYEPSKHPADRYDVIEPGGQQ